MIVDAGTRIDAQRRNCPPPSYTEALQERVKPLEDPEASVVSTETGGTPSELRLTYITGDTLSSGGHGMHWCHIAYWELRQRVGRLFSVFKETVNIFQELPHGDGMCLGVLQRETPASDSVKRTRNKVGIGVTLSKEGDGVWLYNRSEYPVFVNSPTLDPPCVRTLMVHKVLPGYAVKMFDYDLSHLLEQTRRPTSDGPYNPNSIQISFAKGWGPSYSRQFITSCPCWIEVLLNVKR
ncbi:mothers against decapentaplegic homolog 6 isoform X2 [Lingula anatina]|uniref:Mothers against decapentaplegic homolog 6 isoform X2 n=1 Tax=Lingula anatina TaxID=7574 RepID=A0A1S3K9A4_LINAN|nr:mothers against decapentaplegic homolog 6 isoform X2 [Lingula anatina]|eukprot:XP_013418841.1 mothers against decapentaplegic homolog 6 isoform X2 [Lingula anatina]